MKKAALHGEGRLFYFPFESEAIQETHVHGCETFTNNIGCTEALSQRCGPIKLIGTIALVINTSNDEVEGGVSQRIPICPKRVTICLIVIARLVIDHRIQGSYTKLLRNHVISRYG